MASSLYFMPFSFGISGFFWVILGQLSGSFLTFFLNLNLKSNLTGVYLHFYIQKTIFVK